VKNIFLAGHQGFLGNKLNAYLKKKKFNIFFDKKNKLRIDNYKSLKLFFKKLPKIDLIINCAAYIGGIGFMKKKPNEIFIKNSQIISNLLRVSDEFNIKYYLPIGSACSYPANSIKAKEKNFWNGRISEDIEPYGFIKKFELVGLNSLSKKKNIKYTYPIFSNIYGPSDKFDNENSHVIGALIFKFHKAKVEKNKKVTLWGNGNSIRDFIYIDDVVRGIYFIIKKKLFNRTIINFTNKEAISIKNLAKKIKFATEYSGKIFWDNTKPTGVKIKTLNNVKMKKIGFKCDTNLSLGIKNTYEWYKQNLNS